MEKRQKVLIVHNYYQIPGGEDTVVANEKKLLEEHGHEVILYARSNLEIKKMGIIQKLFLPINTIFNLKTYLDIRKIILQKEIDIVHVHNTLSLISPSVYYSAISCKTPIVQTIHNFRLLCPGATFYRDGHICEECIEKGLRPAIKHSCYRNSKLQTLVCVLNIKFHRLTGIYKRINYICLTEFNKEKLLLFKGIRREQVFIKPNFVLDNRMAIPGNQRKEQFVFAGRLDRIKGIDFLLEAWKQMRKEAPRLVICGIGPLETWCRNFIAENRLNNIEMLGLVSNIEVYRIISESKALILPTRWYEGFPMSIVESFSVGTPVICPDLGNAGSIVDEGITGVKFQGYIVKKLIQAIRRLDNYKDIYSTTLNEYKNKYTEIINYQKLFDIYQKIK